MTLGLLAAGQFLLLVGSVSNNLLMAAYAGVELEVFAVHGVVVALVGLVLTVHAVMAASIATLLVAFLAFHGVVALAAFNGFVGVVVEDNRVIGLVHCQPVRGNRRLC